MSKYWGLFVTAARMEDVNALGELNEAVVILNTKPLNSDMMHAYGGGESVVEKGVVEVGVAKEGVVDEGVVEEGAVNDLADRPGGVSTASVGIHLLPEGDDERRFRPTCSIAKSA